MSKQCWVLRDSRYVLGSRPTLQVGSLPYKNIQTLSLWLFNITRDFALWMSSLIWPDDRLRNRLVDNSRRSQSKQCLYHRALTLFVSRCFEWNERPGWSFRQTHPTTLWGGSRSRYRHFRANMQLKVVTRTEQGLAVEGMPITLFMSVPTTFPSFVGWPKPLSSSRNNNKTQAWFSTQEMGDTYE